MQGPMNKQNQQPWLLTIRNQHFRTCCDKRGWLVGGVRKGGGALLQYTVRAYRCSVVGVLIPHGGF